MLICCLTVLGSYCCKALAFGALNLIILCLGIFVGVPDKDSSVFALPPLTMGHMHLYCHFVNLVIVPWGRS